MLVANRPDAAPADQPAAPPRRAYYAAPAIAAVMLLVTLLWGARYDMGIRDPDGIIGWRFTFVLMLVSGFLALDVIPRAVLAARAGRTSYLRTFVALAR